MEERVRAVLWSFLSAVQNLTRLPLGHLPFGPASFGRGTAFFPLVGLLVGCVLIAIYFVGNVLLPQGVVAVLMVIGGLLFTGGMHLDGLIDTVDGLGGMDPGRRLEIMRDSQVGAFGVMGAVSALMLRFVLFQSAVGTAWRAILLAPVVSRCCLVWAIFLFPYVRSQGQGSLYKAYTGWQEVAAATVFTGCLCLGIGGIWGFFLATASFPVTFILGRFFCRLFGGLTGDHYGAVNEVTELFILAAGLAVFR